MKIVFREEHLATPAVIARLCDAADAQSDCGGIRV